jgi:hypothetical protein
MNLPTIDAKGREILTNEEIHNRYNSSWIGFTAMPVCYHNYKAKIEITIPLTFFMAYTYEAHSLLCNDIIFNGTKRKKQKNKGDDN